MENTLIKKIKRYGLGAFVVISFIIHISGFAPKIISELWSTETNTKQTLSAEEVLKQAELQAQADLEKLIEQQRISLREQMKQSFESIGTDVDRQYLDEVWGKVEEQLDDSFKGLEELLSSEDLNSEEFDEQYMELSADMYEKTAELTKNILRQELLSTITKQVQSHTNPKLAKSLDQQMGEHFGQREEKRLTQAAREDTQERKKQALEAVDALRKNINELAAKQKELAKATAEREKAELNIGENEQSDQERDREKAEQKALIEQLNLAQSGVEDLEKRLSESLPDLGKKQTESYHKKKLEGAAQEQTSAQKELEDKAVASTAMQKAATQLEAAVRSFDELKQNINKTEAIDSLAKAALKKLMEAELSREIRQSFDKNLESNLAPKSTEKLVKQAEAYLDDFHMQNDKELMDALRQEVSKTLIAGVPESMKDKAERLALLKTEAKHELNQIESVDKSLELSNEKSLAKRTGEDMTEKRDADVERQLNESLRSVELGDMSEAMAELKAKLQMMNKAEQMAKNIRDGRGDSSELDELMALFGSGQGQGSGRMMSMGGGGQGPGRAILDHQRVKKVMDLAVERQKPGVVYEELQKEADKLVSQSEAFPSLRSAIIIDSRPVSSSDQSEKREAERQMIKPDFNPIKFGYASMRRKEFVLDGKLDEWDLERTQYAQLLYTMDGDVSTLPESEAIKINMMWSNEGYYVAVRVKTDGIHVTPTPDNFWNGDTVELWIDTLNNRAPLLTYVEASQMWFMPFGTTSHPDIVAGYLHGYHIGDLGHTGKNGEDTRRLKRSDKQLQHAHVIRPDGYDIEIFVPQSTLHGPNLSAGTYIGFMLTVNDVRGSQDVSWATRTSMGFERPDTWGDVLLLGSDAEVTFSKDPEGKEVLDVFTPGEPVQIQIHDPDMNIDPRFKDQITLKAIGADGATQLVILGETEVNSGKFKGGVNTHSSFIGEHENSVPVCPGEFLTIEYIDQRCDYGESRKTIATHLAAGWPILKLTKR